MTQADEDGLRKQHQETLRQFVDTELELALTFGQLANSSDNPEKAERNARNAQQAYSSAARFIEGADLSAAENRELQEKATGVRKLLDDFRKKSLK